ncbi:uncharacterized protein LOC128202232 [Galleria mellonella]|uniref:Uncharacterized protein LOC128202232 n=1 Tax=Galleria mellonella TaxID=7137 RepID=A0ABM3N2I6_GALME|nr:uncharacterized protein LOC128202232 [Galleria mellonella]
MATDSETSLRASRGYVKGAITRLHSFVSNESELEESTLQALTTRKERLLTAFREYEGFNMRILSMRPDDDEDVAAVEDKYLYTLTVLNEVISRKTYSVEDSKGHVSTIARSKTKLPAIQMSIFSGNYVEYVAFQSLFTSLIHNDLTLDNVQKLYYLRSYLKNEPYDLIKNLPLTASSYDQARQLLDERYNNRYRIVNEHIGQLLDLPALVKSTPENIRDFVASLKQTLAALQNLDVKVETWDPIIVCILNRKLDTYTARSYQMEKDTAEEHSVKHFIEYLEKRALALENAAPSTAMPSTKAKGLLINLAAAGEKAVTCHYCKSNNHKLFSCNTFKFITSVERYKFCKDNKLCLICLNKHNGKCKFHFKCDQCKKAHNSLVHHDECDEGPVSLLSKGHDSNVLLPTVKVKLFTKDKKTIIVKAILDTGSQASLATSKLIQQLGLTPTPNNTNIIGVGNAQNNIRYCIPLNIHSVNSSFNMTANFYVVEKITCKHPQTKLDIRQLKLPPNIVLADDQFNVPSEINLLMGADIFFHVIMPNEPERPWSRNLHRPLPSQDDITPCIINTRFGYIIGGSMLEYQQASKQVTSLLCIKCDPEINDNIKSFWEAESVPQTFSEDQSEQELAETIFQNSVELIDDRFQVNLPLKVEDNEIHNYLGNSFVLAWHRFLRLERRLQKNINLLSEYNKFIHEYVELGHGDFINFDFYDFDKDAVYFLPHHAVINESSKTTRTRVVFDASMKTDKKVSLNDLLLNGPSVQKELFDVILLFRIGKYTFSTDIRRMFRNILVNPKHRALQNILWRNNPDEAIKCIRLNTVTYGMKSSSYLSTRCLLELTKLFSQEFPIASFILRNCTYVDDILYSSSDLSEIKEAKQQLQSLLQKGSFETHKWSANDPEILSDVPISKQHFDELELQKDNYSMKVLGLNLDVKNDWFNITCPETIDIKSVTKKSILSCIAKFYDPLGFVCPIIVKAKIIMQKLWAEGISWDASPSDHVKEEWLFFIDGLKAMEPIHINRNIPIPLGSKAVQLIGFADASSKIGYGCCVYLRTVDSDCNVRMFLLCAKSRINSFSKPITIPRLELNAALLLSSLVRRTYETLQLKLSIDSVYLFTDSKIVLAWLNTDIFNLHAYVANRVKVITEKTVQFQWNYVNTKENPADLISRGIDPKELPSCSLWWDGPEFIKDNRYNFTNKASLPIDLPELKNSGAAVDSSKVVSVSTQIKSDIYQLIDKYSDINKMIKCNYLTTKELQQSLQNIIKQEQSIHFSKEIKSLTESKDVEGVTTSKALIFPSLPGKILLILAIGQCKGGLFGSLSITNIPTVTLG